MDNSSFQAKKLLDFVKRFSEFVVVIYETCDRNFFNLALIIVGAVFLLVHFILFLRFATNNKRRTMKNFRIPRGVIFSSM